MTWTCLAAMKRMRRRRESVRSG
uniref:Uncharacterized protein n=1 Tax=Anguilla anguilla TaxID=7936 RepID=A0A0E9XKC6_ANGAN